MAKLTLVFLIGAYCLSGSGLVYTNKLVSDGGRGISPFLVLLLQNGVTVVLLLLLEKLSPATTGVLKWPKETKKDKKTQSIATTTTNDQQRVVPVKTHHDPEAPT